MAQIVDDRVILVVAQLATARWTTIVGIVRPLSDYVAIRVRQSTSLVQHLMTRDSQVIIVFAVMVLA